MQEPAALAERFAIARYSSFQVDDVGAAELERAVRGFGVVERAGEVLGDVVDPDRLDPLRPAPITVTTGE